MQEVRVEGSKISQGVKLKGSTKANLSTSTANADSLFARSNNPGLIPRKWFQLVTRVIFGVGAIIPLPVLGVFAVLLLAKSRLFKGSCIF
jgi:hypothetical protein